MQFKNKYIMKQELDEDINIEDYYIFIIIIQMILFASYIICSRVTNLIF
jgi:hypothetical protein